MSITSIGIRCINMISISISISLIIIITAAAHPGAWQGVLGVRAVHEGGAAEGSGPRPLLPVPHLLLIGAFVLPSQRPTI